MRFLKNDQPRERSVSHLEQKDHETLFFGQKGVSIGIINMFTSIIIHKLQNVYYKQTYFVGTSPRENVFLARDTFIFLTPNNHRMIRWTWEWTWLFLGREVNNQNMDMNIFKLCSYGNENNLTWEKWRENRDFRKLILFS